MAEARSTSRFGQWLLSEQLLTPDQLNEALDRSHIHDLLVQPIQIRDRVVNLLYCDNGSSAFGETSVAALGAVADCAARAYERLILDRKKGPGQVGERPCSRA